MDNNPASILSYQPRPEQGGFGGDGKALLESNVNPYDSIQQMLNNVVSLNYRHNAVRLQRAFDDQDKSLEMFSSMDVAADTDPEDKERLISMYDSIKDTMLRYNGNPFANKDGRIEFQDKINKFKSTKALAQARYYEASQQRIAISKETDPETRQKMINHLETEMKDPNKIPSPYQKMLDYELEQVLYNPGFETKGIPTYLRGDDGIVYESKEEYIDPTKIIDYYELPRIMEGENKTLPNQMAIFYDYVVNDERFDNNKLSAINVFLNELNQKNGWKPGDRYYQEPITAGTDDEGKLIPTDDAIGFSRKLALYMYGGKTRRGDAPSEKGQKAFSELALEKQRKASANLSYVRSRKEQALIQPLVNKYNAEAEKARLQGETEKVKQIELEKQMLEPAVSAYRSLNIAASKDNYQPIGEFFKTLPAPIGKEIQKAGVLDGNVEIARLDRSDPTINKMVSKAYYDEDNKRKPGGQVPTYIYAIKPVGGSAKDVKIIGVHKDGEFKIVDYKDAPAELIKADNEYYSNSKVLEKMNSARGVMDELFLQEDNTQSTGDSEIPDGIYEYEDGTRVMYKDGVETKIEN